MVLDEPAGWRTSESSSVSNGSIRGGDLDEERSQHSDSPRGSRGSVLLVGRPEEGERGRGRRRARSAMRERKRSRRRSDDEEGKGNDEAERRTTNMGFEMEVSTIQWP